jgi:hypothetical protein
VRYIDMVRLLRKRDDWPPSEEWQRRIRQAEAELRNLPAGKTRADIFSKYSDVWSNVKDQFRGISHNKCWYCETKVERGFGDMDHHRPKGGVTKTSHPGYWWLGFSWRNWRFSCELCNSKLNDQPKDSKDGSKGSKGRVGGKGNDFPLLGGEDGEKRRVWDEKDCPDYDELKRERPMLLDPTNPSDPELITFGSNGIPRPVEKRKDLVEYQRAAISIQTYHLDQRYLNSRRKEIYFNMRGLIEKIQKYKLTYADDSDNDMLANIIEDKLVELRKMIAPDAQDSSAARAYLRRYRHWSWVDRLLTAS